MAQNVNDMRCATSCPSAATARGASYPNPIYVGHSVCVCGPRPFQIHIGWFVSSLVRGLVLLIGLCERKILFRLKIYDHLRQATAK